MNIANPGRRARSVPWAPPVLAACSLLLTPLARAETSGVSPSGFVVTHALVVDAQPDKVWQAFTQLPRWWNDDHTYSGKASNMSVDAQAGGCWCERWGDGRSAVHGLVVLAQPGSVLRFNAGLGPLQDLAVTGVLTFGTAHRDGQTRLRVTYRVFGSAEAALDKLAPAVDGVIAVQVQRLKTYIETGRPD